MERLTELQTSGIRGLHSDPRFINMIEWIKTSLTQEDAKLRYISEEAQLRIAQGRAQTLAAILQSFEDAKNTVGSAKRS